MTSDDQQFLDVLAEYSNDIKKFTGDVFDTTDRHFAWVASYIKKSVPEGWLPEYARPPPPPPPPHRVTGAYIQRLQDWIAQHRALTAALVAFFATGGLLWWREIRKHNNRKRRARRASNGARREVIGKAYAISVASSSGGTIVNSSSTATDTVSEVAALPRALSGANEYLRLFAVVRDPSGNAQAEVIAGPPSSPIVKSLSLDLERRGFIVYIVCADIEEEQQVQNESRADVRPLRLDVADVLGTQEAMDRFDSLLIRPRAAFSGASLHNLHFRGLVLVPDLIYPSGPIETVTPDLWSDALNAKVLNTIAIAQAFLPTVCGFKARVLVLTPSIVAALRPPFHSVETTIVSALEGFTASLRGELGTLGIDVCQFKLGTFDFSNVGGKQHLQSIGAPNTDSWPATARMSYASNYVNQTRVARSRGLFNQTGSTGSSLRELHNSVFDALTQKHPRRVWRVGRGSVAYDVVGNWIPAGLVGWMLGVRRVSLDQASGPKMEDSVQSWEKVERAV